ncbi:PH domain-containing protein [Arthrobacter sp. Sr24]
MVGSAALAKLQPTTFSQWAPEASQWREAMVFAVVAVVAFVVVAYPVRRVWRWAGTTYTLTNQRLLLRRGLVSRRLQILDLAQVHQMQPVQNWRQRMVGSGDLQLFFHSGIHSDNVVTVHEIPYWSEFNKDAQHFWAKEFRAVMQQTLRERDYAGVVGMNEKELRKLGRDH